MFDYNLFIKICTFYDFYCLAYWCIIFISFFMVMFIIANQHKEGKTNE